MLKKTLETLEAKIKTSANIPEEKKSEYFDILERLNEEINELGKSDKEKAESISGFTKVSAHESTRKEIDQNLITIAADGLNESVKEFEASHPRLVSTVNDFMTFLSKLGI